MSEHGKVPASSCKSVVRDVREADCAKLALIRYPEAIHRARLRGADDRHYRYLCLEPGRDLLGFALLVFKRPATWPALRLLPHIVDLNIRADGCDQGFDTVLIHELERIAAARGARKLTISVDPLVNGATLRLYAALGYRTLGPSKARERWRFDDAGGIETHQDDWVVEMMKVLE